jgi:hypothetical protein
MAREVKPIVRVEDLDERMRRVADELRASGREIGEAARLRRPTDVFRTIAGGTPKYADEFLAEARRVLEDELAVAAEAVGDPAEGEDPIQPAERELEIAKRALVRLKLPQLRRLAVEVDIDSRGSQVELVERIAREYGDDPDEVARLVLEHEEATPTRGLVDRVYGVREKIVDLAAAAEGFKQLAGRYIRVGIAKWFVFGHARVDEHGLWLDGYYRSYSAEATREGEDFKLVSVPTEARAGVRIRPDQRLIEVRARGEAESAAIVKSLEWGTRLRHDKVLLLDVAAKTPLLMRWDPRSVFMLHVLDRRLPRDGVEIINLTSARFETAAAQTRRTRQPTVRAVALHGQHLLSSRAACELLVEGRGLVELSLDVRFRPDANAEFIFPLRISLASDHVSLLTGFGTSSPETAAQLHREILRRLRASLAEGVKSDDRLEALARQIRDRSESTEPDQADIFAPPDDWLEDEDEA